MHPLTRKIASLQRQLMLRRHAVAACRTAAAIIFAATVLGLGDYFFRYRDPGLRVISTSILLFVVVWAIYRWGYLPGRKQLAPLTVARRIESHFPQLNDSLASAMEFLSQDEHDQTAGSAQLRRLVVAEAELAVEGLPLDEVIDRRPLHRAAAWCAAAIITVVFCLAWNAAAVGTALARLAVPLGSTEWPRQDHLEFRNPPTRVAAGQAFEAELINTSGPLPNEVRIEYRVMSDGRRENASEPMKRVGDVMLASRENVRQSFSFRAVGGDDNLMRWHWVDVVEAPQLTSLAIRTFPPIYTGLPPSNAEKHLDVLAGTGISVIGSASEPLSAARIKVDGLSPIDATITADAEGNKSRAFHIDPKSWIATKIGQYSLELVGASGLAGTVGTWNIRVEPDTPPSISWQTPSEDLYVTAMAVLPIELIVKDNLAIARVDLAYARSDWSEAERERLAATAKIELYRGTANPPAINTKAATRGENRIIAYSWDLAPFGVPVGAEITIEAEAADYRPNVSRTASPRRITIITPDELDARLAGGHAQIVRQLERALAIQQPTHEEVRRVEIALQTARSLATGDHNSLQSAELNQRRVERILVDPAEGVQALIDSLQNELAINRIATSETHGTLDRLTSELDRLSDGPLAVASSELTASRKADDANDSATSDPQNLSKSLSAAGAAQDDVIATLERLITELSGKVDYRRFVRLLTELRQDQILHTDASRKEIGVETLPLRLNELTRAQKATLQKAVAGQTALAARYAKIEDALDRLVRQQGVVEGEAAQTLDDALALARSLAIASQMHDSETDLSENRVGSALEREIQIAADLQQVIKILRGEAQNKPEQIVDQLRNAEERLAALQKQLAELRTQIEQATPEQLQSLSQKQDDTRSEIEKLARQLDRLQASEASQSAESAAKRLDNRKPSDNQTPQNAKTPSSTSEVEKAEQDLNEAAQKLAEQRQQAEEDLALEIVRRFQAELTEMVERQKQVVDKTVALAQPKDPPQALPEDSASLTNALATEERNLAELAKEHGELLVGLGAVRTSLEDAERRLNTAAAMLDVAQTGKATQASERHALARLEGMLEAFAQTAQDATSNQQPQQPPPAAGAPSEQPPRRPTFELLEVKMLRMLQVDLQQRTQAHETRLAEQKTSTEQSELAKLQQESQELAAEQGRLAELVESMLKRDNEQDTQEP